MKHLSIEKLAVTVASKRKTMKLSQSAIAENTGINRSLLSRLESLDYTPSVDQLLALSEVLGFDYSDFFVDDEVEVKSVERKKIAVAGTGYVGLSLAVLLSQHNDVTAVDIVPEKVEKLNNWQSPIQDDFIEQYLAEHEERQLSLKATTDGESAYKDADFIIVAAPTNYDPKTNFFDCSAVEAVLELIKKVTDKKKNKPTIVIKSTIPVGYTAQVREKLGMNNIIFSPEFLRESKALYDNLYPSRIIVGSDEANLVYASSSSVYGGNKKIPFSADDKVDNPVSLYAATKKSDELIAHSYSKLYNIPSTGLRFFTVYGPAGRPDMFYYSATNTLANNGTIKIFNYGNCKRDFTYIDDIVEGVYRVMQGAPEKQNGEDGLPVPPYALYNIGGGTPENLLDYISTLQEELVNAGVLPADYDFEGHRELVGMQPGDVPVTYADSKGLEDDYGFRPTIGISEGLRKFAQWYAEYYK